jgi:hypothetical protein
MHWGEIMPWIYWRKEIMQTLTACITQRSGPLYLWYFCRMCEQSDNILNSIGIQLHLKGHHISLWINLPNMFEAEYSKLGLPLTLNVLNQTGDPLQLKFLELCGKCFCLDLCHAREDSLAECDPAVLVIVNFHSGQ